MDRKSVHIVAVPDRLVRDPATQRAIDEVGIDVDPADLYWSRVIADEDVAIFPSADESSAPSNTTRTAPVLEA